jgi:hypothetical protein
MSDAAITALKETDIEGLKASLWGVDPARR